MTEGSVACEGFYEPKEELSNAITHGIGAVFAIVALYVLVVRSTSTGDIWKIVTCIIFGVSLIITYTSSALYHGLTNERWKGIMRIVDHVAIYLLIAGTYTPFMLIVLGGAWGWSMFIVVWLMAVVGISLRLVKYEMPDYVSTIPYLVMGWIAIIAIKPLLEFGFSEGWGGLMLLVVGGLFYSFGTIFYGRKEVPYNHTIWHLFVLAGSIAHFFAVLDYVVPSTA